MTPSVGEISLRLGCAAAAGFVLGWERERHGRPAGLRTNMLACIASAIAMLVSEILLARTADSSWAIAIRADPARLGAGILTGFGFLGAGTIIRHENFVRGVTTAATVWFGAVLGLAFGSGLLLVGALGTAVALVVLMILPAFEKGLPSDWYAILTVSGALHLLKEDNLKQQVEHSGIKVLRMKLNYDVSRQEKTVICDLKLTRGEAFDVSTRLAEGLVRAPGVTRVEWA
jgi:putative Mg2+ transporter-C (MgtC) family protein